MLQKFLSAFRPEFSSGNSSLLRELLLRFAPGFFHNISTKNSYRNFYEGVLQQFVQDCLRRFALEIPPRFSHGIHPRIHTINRSEASFRNFSGNFLQELIRFPPETSNEIRSDYPDYPVPRPPRIHSDFFFQQFPWSSTGNSLGVPSRIVPLLLREFLQSSNYSFKFPP